MRTLTAIFCALFGLVFGSFLNVCIERLPRHQSVITPRSRCPHCGIQIRSYDNVPLLSWLLLKGRCRSCKRPISYRYSFVEAATAGLFVACYLRFGMTLQGAGLAILCFLLLGLAMMDAETMLLPDAFTLPGLALGILWAAAGHSENGYDQALTAAFHSAVAGGCAAGTILFIRWLYWLLRHRHGVGIGDAKLLAMIAVWLPPAHTLLTFFLAVVGAAVFAAGVRIFTERRGHDWLSTRLPLGSFLAAATIYSIFFGAGTLKWYMSFFP